MNDKAMDMAQVHEVLLDMLRYFDGVCRENGITYFLSGGSTLGAVREGGFIPWDDDVDIMMPRGDYDRLDAVLSRARGGNYTYHSLRERDWDRPYACLMDDRTTATHTYMKYRHMGVTMDILPMDGVCDTVEATREYYRKLRRRYVFYYAAIKQKYMDHERHLAVKKVVEAVSKLIGAHRLCVGIDRAARQRSYDTSDYVGCAVLHHYMERERFKREWFREPVYLDFEGEKLPVMNGYREYLGQLYGDYMKRPENPVNPDHSTTYYWK